MHTIFRVPASNPTFFSPSLSLPVPHASINRSSGICFIIAVHEILTPTGGTERLPCAGWVQRPSSISLFQVCREWSAQSGSESLYRIFWEQAPCVWREIQKISSVLLSNDEGNGYLYISMSEVQSTLGR